MEIRIQRTDGKIEQKYKSVRIKTESEKKADKLLIVANKKKFSRAANEPRFKY